MSTNILSDKKFLGNYLPNPFFPQQMLLVERKCPHISINPRKISGSLKNFWQQGCQAAPLFPALVKGIIRARKKLQNSEFSEGRLFDKIEWGPPLNTKNRLNLTFY